MADVPTTAELSDLIGQVYDAALEDGLWPKFLQSLAQCFGTDQALISNVDPAPCPGGFVSTVGMDIDIISKWAGSKEHIDVWYHSLQAKHQHSPYSDSDLCSARFWKKSAFFADVLRPLNIQHTLGGLYIESQRRNWVFAIIVTPGAASFRKETRNSIGCSFRTSGEQFGRINRWLMESDCG